MKIRFLLDENLTPKLKAALLRLDPTIDVVRVGDDQAPPLGTLDPDLLRYLETAQRLLVTDNRHTMPGHIIDHFAAGGHHWGVYLVLQTASIGQIVDGLYLLWAVSEAEEWKDRMEWLAF